MKYNDNIGSLRLLNVRVYLNDNEVIYEGMIEDALDEIKKYVYSKIMIDDEGITNLYVYTEKQ